MTDKRPVVLLDVDGVLNAITRKPNTAVWPFDHWKFGKAATAEREWPIAWATDVVDWLNALDDSGRAEILWHTTWLADAQNIAALLGLNRFGVADSTPEVADGDVYGYESQQMHVARLREGVPAWWKYGAARRVLESGRPLIWMDDDIPDQLPRVHRDNLAANGAVLFLSPDEHTGLAPKHLRQAEQFLDAVDVAEASRELLTRVVGTPDISDLLPPAA